MAEQARLHPSREELHAFAQGRLPPAQVAAVEGHVAACDSCCAELENAPADTLLQLAREAATLSFHVDAKPTPKAGKSRAIPAELSDHPRYRVLGLIGSGGMGAVYKAQHRLMERLVALKVISPDLLQNEAAVDRFRREFRAVARLSHPNIVTAFDAEQAGNLHFLVMEFVEGLSLDQLVAQRGPLSIRQACHLLRQAALGLAHMHERGMVHRDIKPQNLMVGRQEKLKILDCGLARLTVESPADTGPRNATGLPGQTQAGMILGTPDYMAPEQIANAAAADIRADIYSLGCTLYFALAGRPPFPQGSAMEKLLAHAQRPPEPIASLRADVPPELARVIERMLAKNPDQRFQAPAEVAVALAPFADVDAIEPAEPLPAPSAPAAVQLAELPTIRRENTGGQGHGQTRWAPIGIALAACVVLLLAIPVSGFLLSKRPQKEVRPAAGPGKLPAKALLVIPRWGLWFADYEDVKNGLLKHDIDVVVASSAIQQSKLQPGEGARTGVAMPDIKLDRSIRVSDYGAIVFVGLATDEYHPGSPTGAAAGRLLSEFQRENRFLTAICGGQKALATHGLLSGKRVAHSDYADRFYQQANALPQSSRVERDGRIITAAADIDAAEFAAAIAAALRE